MLWYGFKGLVSPPKLNNYLQITRHHRNLKTHRLKFLTRIGGLRAVNVFWLPLLANWKLLILARPTRQTAHLYLYSSIYFFHFPVRFGGATLGYSRPAQHVVVSDGCWTTFYLVYWLWIKNLFFSFSRLFFLKVTFKGKGYYVYKGFRNTIALRFGYSHRIYLYAFDITLTFVTKTIVLIFGLNKFDLLSFARAFYAAKPINIFTGRGVRFARQIIYKKTGKVSTYR